MGLPGKLLAEGERPLLVLHPHVRRLARAAVVLLVLVPVASFATASVPAGPARPAVRLALAAVAVLLALWFVVRPFVVWWNTIYVLTDERIFERQGVVRRQGHDLPLRGVTDVVVSQRLTERLLGSGTLRVTTEGGSEFTVRDVPAVGLVQASLLAVADDVTARLLRPLRPPRAELGEPGLDDEFAAPGPGPGDRPDDGHDDGHDGLFDDEYDDEYDDGSGLDDVPGRLRRREARRRDREHARRLRELQTQVRASPPAAPSAAGDEAAFESLLDPADLGDGDDDPPEGARILRFPRRP